MSVVRVQTNGCNKNKINSVQIGKEKEKKRWGDDGEPFGTTQEVPSGMLTITVIHGENDKFSRTKEISVDSYKLTVTLDDGEPKLGWVEL
jgi:hypothetical protein